MVSVGQSVAVAGQGSSAVGRECWVVYWLWISGSPWLVPETVSPSSSHSLILWLALHLGIAIQFASYGLYFMATYIQHRYTFV